MIVVLIDNGHCSHWLFVCFCLSWIHYYAKLCHMLPCSLGLLCYLWMFPWSFLSLMKLEKYVYTVVLLNNVDKFYFVSHNTYHYNNIQQCNEMVLVTNCQLVKSFSLKLSKGHRNSSLEHLCHLVYLYLYDTSFGEMMIFLVDQPLHLHLHALILIYSEPHCRSWVESKVWWIWWIAKAKVQLQQL